jgi:hypothetical protein
MRRTGWIAGGTMAALLLAAPAGGQDTLELSHGDFDLGVFADDDFRPVTGFLGLPESERLQRQYLAGLIEPQPALSIPRFYMIGASVSDPELQPDLPGDFSVTLVARHVRNDKGGNSRNAPSIDRDGHVIIVVSRPVPSAWYRSLFAERNTLAGGTLRDATQQQFTDIRMDPSLENPRMRELREAIARRLAGRETERCEVPIDSLLASRVDGLISNTLLRTNYNSSVEVDPVRADTARIDSPFEHYFIGYGREAHVASSMFRGTRPQLAVVIGTAMRDYCLTRDAAHLEVLRQAVNQLQRRVTFNSKYEPPAEKRK